MKNLDTQGLSERALIEAKRIILRGGHLFEEGNGNIDKGIDGYIRLRKRAKLRVTSKDGRITRCENYIETGNIVGVQIKGVSRVPTNGSQSYYITKQDKSVFGINFQSKNNLSARKKIWLNFIAPVILIFVDLETEKLWWGNLKDESIYDSNGYSITLKKEDVFDKAAFKAIAKLGRELFLNNSLPNISVEDHWPLPERGDFKTGAKAVYGRLSNASSTQYSIRNPTLGKIQFSRSGWKHITRLNRNKLRINNSLMLLPVCKPICETVEQFSKVRKGQIRESEQYIKSVDYLTLRAKVEFTYRQESIVQVVLRRVKTFDKLNQERIIPTQIFFHSVYEPFRKES